MYLDDCFEQEDSQFWACIHQTGQYSTCFCMNHENIQSSQNWHENPLLNLNSVILRNGKENQSPNLLLDEINDCSFGQANYFYCRVDRKNPYTTHCECVKDENQSEANIKTLSTNTLWKPHVFSVEHITNKDKISIFFMLNILFLSMILILWFVYQHKKIRKQKYFYISNINSIKIGGCNFR